ncbi:GNAT family N-acetyltransferase [Candidatus Woesearchaeota archaeon]|nr:GNAT family N-acetyltransferase [Candidatus Woesearchaeota archaeon]
MEKQRVESYGIKFTINEGELEVARTFLYVMNNGLHEEPFGLMEDVFVKEGFRERGYGEQLVRELIAEARQTGCYKLICTSRTPWVQDWYVRLGFEQRGLELRMDL